MSLDICARIETYRNEIKQKVRFVPFVSLEFHILNTILICLKVPSIRLAIALSIHWDSMFVYIYSLEKSS